MSAKTSTYEKDGKTFPMLQLKKTDDDKFPFQFGVGKARLILNHLDAIKSFVEKNSNGR